MGRRAGVTRIALRLATGATLAFIYIPIGVIVLYSFNAATSCQLADHGADARLVRPGVQRRGHPRRRCSTSLQAAIGATAVALVLGSLLAFAVHRFRFFGREALSFLVILPIALPGIVTGIALNTAFRTIGIDFGLLTIIIGHATFCVVVIYNNVIARLRRTARVDRGGVDGPRRGHVADLPPRDVPGDPDGARGRRAAGLRPVVRRDHRDDVHRPGRARRRCRSGSSATTSGRTSCRSSTSRRSSSWSLSIIPVYLASRLTVRPGRRARARAA